MDEQQHTESTIKAEFEALGRNMRAALQAAWESEQRRKVQSEIERALNEVGEALDDMVTGFQSGEHGQRVRDEVEDIGERLRSGEVAEQARTGLLQTLQRINAELERTMQPKDE